MGTPRAFETGETVIVTSEGRYPSVDFKEGIVNNYRNPKRAFGAGKGNNQYLVYFPELDKYYWILATYLTSTEAPSEEQIERFHKRGIITGIKSSLEYRSLEKEVRPLSREYFKLRHSRQDEAERQYREGSFKSYIEEMSKRQREALSREGVSGFTPEEELKIVNLGLVKLEEVPYPRYTNIEPSFRERELAEEVVRKRKEQSKLISPAFQEIKRAKKIGGIE